MSRRQHPDKRVRKLEAQLKKATNPVTRELIRAELEWIAEDRAEQREQEGLPRWA